MNKATLRGIIGIILVSLLIVVIIQNVVNSDESTKTIEDEKKIETSTSQTTQPTQTPKITCDPSYPDICIPPWPPDLNCGDIPHKKFKVIGDDKHNLDRDGDGIGCES